MRSTDALVAELRQFNHHESATALRSLAFRLEKAREAAWAAPPGMTVALVGDVDALRAALLDVREYARERIDSMRRTARVYNLDECAYTLRADGPTYAEVAGAFESLDVAITDALAGAAGEGESHE